MNSTCVRALLFATAAIHGVPAAQTLTIGSEAPPLDIAHWMKGEEVAGFDLDLALQYARRAVELDPLDYHCTMLAGIHGQRGEFEQAVSVQQRAIDALEAKRSKILPREMSSFEAELSKLREQLEGYRAKRK